MRGILPRSTAFETLSPLLRGIPGHSWCRQGMRRRQAPQNTAECPFRLSKTSQMPRCSIQRRLRWAQRCSGRAGYCGRCEFRARRKPQKISRFLLVVRMYCVTNLLVEPAEGLEIPVARSECKAGNISCTVVVARRVIGCGLCKICIDRRD